MSAAAAYANRRRNVIEAGLHQPRNIAAEKVARERSLPLMASFVGDIDYSNPTVYCSSGERYDWRFTKGLHVVVVVKAGVDLRDALHSILEQTDTIDTGYPVLLDVERQDIACVVEDRPVGLWPIRKGSNLWQQFFSPQT